MSTGNLLCSNLTHRGVYSESTEVKHRREGGRDGEEGGDSGDSLVLVQEEEEEEKSRLSYTSTTTTSGILLGESELFVIYIKKKEYELS